MSAPDEPRPTYATAHEVYRAAGWIGPLPLPDGKKWPPPDGWTGWAGLYPSFADSIAWTDPADYGDTSQLALRMAETVIGIDVDHYGAKRGADTLAEAERRWGPLPDAPYSSARGAGPSGIRFYRVPAGTTLRTKIGFPELNLGDIEIIQRHHRYAVVWPSTNPQADGAPYAWHNTAGPDRPPNADKLLDLPAAWLEALSSDAEPGVDGATPQQVRTFHEAHSLASAPAALRGAVKVFERDAASGTRHDAMVNAACMATREARAGKYSATEAMHALEATFVRALAEAKDGQRLVTPDEARREFASVWSWAVGQALSLSVDQAQERSGNVRREGGRKLGRAAVPSPAPSSSSSSSSSTSPAAAATTVHALVEEPAAAPLRVVGDGELVEPGPASTWRPLDLGPYLAGGVARPEPSIGLARRDGVRLFYPGKEHSVIGEMEAGKSWVVLASVAAELAAGNTTIYVHFEEEDPTDTVERLILLGADPDDITERFLFIAPGVAITGDVADYLVRQEPTLVVLDGQNEAMALHGLGIREEDGAAAYRRYLVKPFTAAGAAVISCDHVVKDNEKSAKGYALGSIHKGNGINGTIILLENTEPFGIGRRGASKVYVTKDRPGMVRQHGQPTSVPRKFYLGTVSVDATVEGVLDLQFWAPAKTETLEDPLERTAQDWDHPGQAELPDDVAAYRGKGMKSVPDLARFVRAMGQGGIGVDLTGARAALCAVKINGRPKHDKETVGRAWGALWEMGRITPSDVNTHGNARGLHYWAPKPGDPAETA